MLRRSLSAALVMFVVGGFLVAGTHTGVVTKIEDGKVTVKMFKKGEDPTEKTFKISKDAKFIRKAKDKDGEDKELKLDDVKEMIAKAKEAKKGKGRGGFAKIETTGEGDDETITKITFGGGRRKKTKDE
jgi:hypothetical protein